MSDNRRKKFYLIVAWLLTGAVVLWCAFFTSANGFGRISFAKDDNKIIEVPDNLITYFIREDDHLFAVIYPGKLGKDIHYLRLEAEGVEGDDSVVSYAGGFIDDNNEFVPDYVVSDAALHNGANYIGIEGTDYEFYKLEVKGDGALKIKSIEFRESNEEPSIAENMKAVLAAALIYILISAAVYLLFKKRADAGKSMLPEDIEIRLLAQGGSDAGTPAGMQKIAPKLSGRVANGLTGVLFFALITNSLLAAMNAYGVKYIRDFHVYLLTQLVIIAAAALVIYLGGELIGGCERIDRSALIVCTALMLYTLISDLLVDKRFRFAGIGMFVVLTAFAIIWNRVGGSRYIKIFEIAVQVFLLLLVILSVFRNSSGIDGRFAGPLLNPGIFALIAGGIWAVLLGSLEHHIVAGESLPKKLITCAELLVTLILVVLSQSMTALVAMAATAMLWIFRLVARRRGLRFAILLVVILAATGLILLAALFAIAGSSNAFTNSRLLAKFQSAGLSSFLSGRDYYWRAYLRKLNLFGHGGKIKLWGMTINPHNAVIGMAYMYGVPCIIPYILMFMMAIEKSYRFADKKLPYAAVPLYAVVSFVIMGIADNVEQPLVWLPTIACYLLMAPILALPLADLRKSNGQPS